MDLLKQRGRGEQHAKHVLQNEQNEMNEKLSSQITPLEWRVAAEWKNKLLRNYSPVFFIIST